MKKKIGICLLVILALLAVYIGEKRREEGVQLAVYRIEKGKMLEEILQKEISPKEAKRYAHLWSCIQQLLPEDCLAYIHRFFIETDGIDGTTAYVDSQDGKNYILSVDAVDLLDLTGRISEDGIFTLVHETAHILSMNEEEMTEKQEEASSYTVEEGTFKKHSYMAAFYTRFWEKDFARFQKDEEAYYMTHKGDFVSEYAATNPVEDFAETFAVFVTEELPKGSSIREEKIRFFAEYPELLRLREDFRKRIALVRKKTAL